MKKTLILTSAMTFLSLNSGAAQDWKMQPLQIPTRWAALVSPTNALPEYPRPQLVRESWKNLNGLWDYAITAKEDTAPATYEGSILVPYPLESALSGVEKSLMPNQLLWYRRTIAAGPAGEGKRTLLHFGAVDYQATVYVNGHEAGSHTGGYQAFTLDVTDLLKSGDNELVIKVWDPTEAGPNPHGKQGMQYTASSGIWQTVWLEAVPQTYIESLSMTPDMDRSQLLLRVNLHGDDGGYSVQAVAKSGTTIAAKQIVSGTTALRVDHPHLWSPDDPFLYDLDVRLLKAGKVVDEVKSYFGMRKIEVRKDSAGVERIFLNNKYIYNLGVLDQGFWPDGLYTAPTDAALKFDVEALKAMGFNTIRKHVKIEPDRWYYDCDQLGMLVWQDMVNPSDGTPQARTEFEKETRETIEQLSNHPSITTWVLFNELFGAPYDRERLSAWVKRLDPSRILNGHTGPFDEERTAQWMRHSDPVKISKLMNGDMDEDELNEVPTMWGGEPAQWDSDMTDLHQYPGPGIPAARPGKTSVLGEFGGVGVVVEEHVWDDYPGFGYIQVATDQMTKTYAGMVDKLKGLESQGLSGSIYTQITDVESEQNGLMTYDRAVTKIPVPEIARINSQLVPTAKNYAAATRGFSVPSADLTPEAQRYAALLAEYRKGRRDLPFLRHFTLIAIRQKDQAHATEAGNAFIDGSPQPYPKAVWDFIYTITNTSNDRGFELLRTQTAQANAALSTPPNSSLPDRSAEAKIREVIGREEIGPYIADKSQAPDWPAIEEKVIAKYGPLGAEEVYGKRMMYALGRQDWTNFGKYYALYFSTASRRSEYPINNLSYLLYQHVTDPQVLDAAISAVKNDMDSGKMSVMKDDPTEIDTYANLLYRSGRNREAIEWEEKAVSLSHGSDKEIADCLETMKAGLQQAR